MEVREIIEIFDRCHEDATRGLRSKAAKDAIGALLLQAASIGMDDILEQQREFVAACDKRSGVGTARLAKKHNVTQRTIRNWKSAALEELKKGKQKVLNVSAKI